MFPRLHVELDHQITRLLLREQRRRLNYWMEPPAPDSTAGPRRPSPIELTPLRSRRRWRVLSLAYDSPLASGYSVNDRARGLVLEPLDPARGTVLAVHGWLDHATIELEAMGLYFARRGYRVVLPMLPFHIERCVPGTFDGQLVVIPHTELMGLAFNQALAEIEYLLGWLRSSHDGPLVLAGASLGGLLVAHALSRPLELDRAYVLIAGADLARTIEECELFESFRLVTTAMGISRRELRRRLEPFDPARKPLAVPRERVRLHGGLYDPVFAPAQVQALAQSWGITAQFHPAAHVSIFTAVRRIFADLP